jgi:uncharacterized membrane protein YcaP (DUF421 family)
MRKELVSMEELMSQLREQGVEHLSEVKECCLEGDGHISVIKKEPGGDSGSKKKGQAGVS